MTRSEYINKIKTEARVPEWFIRQIWTDADFDVLLESEDEEEYIENREEFGRDIEMYISTFKRLLQVVPNIEFEEIKK